MDTLTWFHLSVEDRASIIDLAFTNEVAFFTRQLRDLSIMDGPIPLSDHTTLFIPFYSLTNLALIPPLLPRDTALNLNTGMPR